MVSKTNGKAFDHFSLITKETEKNFMLNHMAEIHSVSSQLNSFS